MQIMSDTTSQTAAKRKEARYIVPSTSIRKIEADGVQVFYRAAGDPNAPVVLLLHGFPASSEEKADSAQPQKNFGSAPKKRRQKNSRGPLVMPDRCLPQL